MPQLSPWYSRVAIGLPIVATLVALAGLAILALDRPLAQRLVDAQVELRPDIALGLVVVGVAALLVSVGRWRRVALGLEVLGLGVLAVVCLNWFVSDDIGLGDILAPGMFAAVPKLPAGAVPPVSIVGYALLLAAVHLASRPDPGAWIASQVLGIAACGLAFFSIVSWVVGPAEMIGLVPYLFTPLVSGVVFAMLGIGIMLIHPSVGPISLAVGPGLAPVVMRIFLILAAIGLPVAGWVRRSLELNGAFGAATGVALYAAFVGAGLVAATFVTGALVRRSEAATIAAEAERDRLHEAASESQRLESIGLLAGGIAHDFNNLLTAIGGYADLLAEDLPAGSAGARDLDEIRAATVRASTLTRQLLTYAGRQVMTPSPTDVAAVARELEPMLHRLIGEDVVTEVQTPPQAALASVDRGQLEQVIVNLALNARAAMRSGGRLTIAVATAAVDDAWCASHPEARPGRFVVLSVADTGDGIPVEVRPHIFEPFFTTRREGGGTGLGLSTVSGIVRQSGGWIVVESEVGRGTTFRVHLPTAGDVAADPEAGPPATPGAGAGVILLAEDEPALRSLGARVLEQAGYRVVACASGEEAHSRARDLAHVDLLLTDIVMGGMTGVELADRFGVIHPDVPVLFMSGYAQDRLGPYGSLVRDKVVLAKPFSTAALRRAVHEALETRSASPSGSAVPV